MADTRYQLEGNAPQLYERETVHTLGRPLAERMFDYVSLSAGDRVLDAACGTGIVTRVAIQRCGDLGHVVGVDLNAGMLDVARANTPATRVPIEWRQSDVCALPFPSGRFEVVLCQQGLQFVLDPGAALRELRRVLVPGGPKLAHKWLRVLGHTEPSQIDERVGHQLHAVVPTLEVFETQRQPLEFLLPRKRPLHAIP